MKGSIIESLGQDSLGAVSSWPCSGSPEAFKPSVGHGQASTAKSWPGQIRPWKSLWSCPQPTEHRSNRCHHSSSPARAKGIYCIVQSRGNKGAATQRSPGQLWAAQLSHTRCQRGTISPCSWWDSMLSSLKNIHEEQKAKKGTWTHLIRKANSQLNYNTHCCKYNNAIAFKAIFHSCSFWAHLKQNFP